ncbi:MAG: two-component system cell cycle response regulator [Pseudohongiellaceae bacterium]|jgi:diguanylate cyclase (GGDEF)-like protein
MKLELKRANRYGTIFSILMIDINWFKRVNDRFGDQVGDLVLQETAAILLNNARSVD